MSNVLMDALSTNRKNFVSFFSPTDNRFWCSESGSAMTSSRQWVQNWELFTIIKDPNSGSDLIQSDQTKLYVALNSENLKMYCKQNRAVLEAQFKIDRAKGSIKSKYNKRYITTEKQGGCLIANSTIAVGYDIFEIEQIAISNIDISAFAKPCVVKSKSIITMNSKDPYTFFLLHNTKTDEFFLETGTFEFILPNNTTEPLSYLQTAIDVNNYSLKIEPVKGEVDLYTICAQSTKKYITISTTEEYGDALYASADDAEGTASQFKIISTR